MQRLRLDLLAHHHLVGAEIRDIERDVVGERALGRIVHDRQADGDLADDIAAAGRRIERRAGGFLQPIKRHQLGDGGDRALDLEPRARRRRFRMRVRHLEHAVAHGRACARAPHRRCRGRPTTALRPLIRVVRSASRIAGNPSTGRSGGVADVDLDREPVIGDRRAAFLQRGIGAVGGDLDARDVAAEIFSHHPVAHLGGDEHRPDALGAAPFIGVPTMPPESRGSPGEIDIAGHARGRLTPPPTPWCRSRRDRARCAAAPDRARRASGCG